MATNTTGQKTPRALVSSREAESNHRIYSGSYRIGQKTLKDFLPDTQKPPSPDEKKEK